MTPYEAAAVFAAFESADDYESLTWRVDMSSGRDVRLFALCSDFFHLATADCEEITAADVPLLESCLADLKAIAQLWYLAELFSARKRRMRPCAAACRGMSGEVEALFGACSTEGERAQVDRQDAAFWLHVARKARIGQAEGEAGC